MTHRTISKDLTASLLGKLFSAQVIAVLAPSSTNATFKLQVRIPALHAGIPDEDLPYAIISRGIFVGANANIGWSSCPRVGSWVTVMFDGGTDLSLYAIGEPFGKAQLVTGFGVDDYGFKDQHGNTFKVDADGNLSYTTTHNITVAVNGGVTQINANGAQVQIDANGVVSVNAPSQINMTAPTVTVNGDLVVNGNATVTGVITGQGGASISGGAGAVMTGGLSVDTATIGGISFTSHIHGGVQTGGGTTGVPQ